MPAQTFLAMLLAAVILIFSSITITNAALLPSSSANPFKPSGDHGPVIASTDTATPAWTIRTGSSRMYTNTRTYNPVHTHTDTVKPEHTHTGAWSDHAPLFRATHIAGNNHDNNGWPKAVGEHAGPYQDAGGDPGDGSWGRRDQGQRGNQGTI